MYSQWVSVYLPVGYNGITQWAGVVPESTRVPIVYPGTQ